MALKWHGLILKGPRGRILAEVAPDAKWPKVYRVKLRGSDKLSDMVNLTRAKDAAKLMALAVLNEIDLSRFSSLRKSGSFERC